MSISVKRVYDPPVRSDGMRILVDRIWPRGMTKEAARVDAWLRGLAPSDALRTWFGHRPDRWEEFRRRYWKELRDASRTELVKHLRSLARQRHVTLLFGARDAERNQAVALFEFMKQSTR